MATTKTSPTKMATTAIKKKKASSKRSTLSPNSNTSRNRKNDDSFVYKATNDKGKYNFINSSKMTLNNSRTNVHSLEKRYNGIVKPSYTVTSKNYDVKSEKHGPKTKHFEKSIDTTGFAAGKKNFTVVSKQKLPGGNMYKITKSKTDRKGALDTINRMKKRARKPFTSTASKTAHSKPLTTKKK